jgi:hypothetical protein
MSAEERQDITNPSIEVSSALPPYALRASSDIISSTNTSSPSMPPLEGSSFASSLHSSATGDTTNSSTAPTSQYSSMNSQQTVQSAALGPVHPSMPEGASGPPSELPPFEVLPMLMRKDKSLKDFLNMMDETAPIVSFRASGDSLAFILRQ